MYDPSISIIHAKKQLAELSYYILSPFLIEIINIWFELSHVLEVICPKKFSAIITILSIR